MSQGDPRVIFDVYDLSTRADMIPQSYVAVVFQSERGPMWQGVPVASTEEEKLLKTFGDSVLWTTDVLEGQEGVRNGANVVFYRIGHCSDPSDRSTCTTLPASVLLPDRGGSDTPGSITSRVSPFTFQQSLPGQVTGTELGPFTFVLGANDAFKIKVGLPGAWGPDQTVTMTAGVGRTAQQACDDINTGTDGLNATVVGNKVHMEAIDQGNDIEVLAVANDCYSTLGLSAAAHAHVAGTDSLVVSIDGEADQTFDLQPLNGETGQFTLTSTELVAQLHTLTGGAASAGLGHVTITSGTTGPDSTVQVQSTSTADTPLEFDNLVHSGATGSVKYPWRVKMLGPGAYANGAKLYVYDDPINTGTAINVRLVVPGADEEYFAHLTNDPNTAWYWKNYIISHSDLITIVDVDTPNANPNDWPALSSGGYTFADGDDGDLVLSDADWLGDAAGRTGLYCTDAWQLPFIDIFICGSTSPVVEAGLHEFLSNRKGRVGHMATPPGLNAQEAVARRMGDPDYGYEHAPFNSWEATETRGRLTILDRKNNQRREVSALPYLAAAICRTDRQYGYHVSPFGVKRGQIPGVLGIDDNVAESASDADLLFEYQINNARILRTSLEYRGWEGAYLWGGQTLQRAASKLRELQIVRKLKWYEWILLPIGLGFINDPNHPKTWREVYRQLNPIFRHDVDQDAIFGYFLCCDQDAFFTAEGTLKGAVLNTGYTMDQGIYRCRALIQPVPQIFYFCIEMGVMATGEPFTNYSTMYSLPGWAKWQGR